MNPREGYIEKRCTASLCASDLKPPTRSLARLPARVCTRFGFVAPLVPSNGWQRWEGHPEAEVGHRYGEVWMVRQDRNGNSASPALQVYRGGSRRNSDSTGQVGAALEGGFLYGVARFVESLAGNLGFFGSEY